MSVAVSQARNPVGGWAIINQVMWSRYARRPAKAILPLIVTHSSRSELRPVPSRYKLR